MFEMRHGISIYEPPRLCLFLSLSVTAQTTLMKRYTSDSLTRDLCFHFHLRCRTISKFPFRIKIETFDSSIQVGKFQAWRPDKCSDTAMASRFSSNRGISSIGRAPALHAGGPGIDVRILQVLLSLLILSSRYSLGKDPILAIGPMHSLWRTANARDVSFPYLTRW